MPDILIHGMEMPPSCADCPFCLEERDDYDEPTTYCVATKIESPSDLHGVIDGINHQKGRMWFCPLHELPPHGDLIDRDAILNAEKTKPIAKMMMFGGAYVIDLDVVRDAPVVVPAERSGTDA